MDHRDEGPRPARYPGADDDPTPAASGRAKTVMGVVIAAVVVLVIVLHLTGVVGGGH